MVSGKTGLVQSCSRPKLALLTPPGTVLEALLKILVDFKQALFREKVNIDLERLFYYNVRLPCLSGSDSYT